MTDEIETRRGCPGCGTAIALLKTDTGKFVPVNVLAEAMKKFDDVDPDDDKFVYGKHESHFTTCTKMQPLRDLIRGLNSG